MKGKRKGHIHVIEIDLFYNEILFKQCICLKTSQHSNSYRALKNIKIKYSKCILYFGTVVYESKNIKREKLKNVNHGYNS